MNKPSFIRLSLAVALAVTSVVATGCISSSSTGAPRQQPPVVISKDTNTGVVAINGRTIEPAKVAVAMQMVATVGSAYAVQKDPNAAPYLIAAAVVIQAKLNDGVYDAEGLQKSIDLMPDVKDSAEARMAITTGIAAYSLLAADINELEGINRNAYVIPIGRALAKGLEAGARSALDASLAQKTQTN